jgi:hypothetical protein
MCVLALLSAAAVRSAGGAVARKVTVTRYPITLAADSPEQQIVLAEGEVWVSRGSTVRRVDLGAEPLVGQVQEAPVGTNWPVYAGGRFWDVGLDRSAPCPPYGYLPYVVTGIDATTGAPPIVVRLFPDLCRYGGDNRDPFPFAVAGGTRVWVNVPPLTTSDWRVVILDSASGAPSEAAVGSAKVAVVAADTRGAWTASVDPSDPAGPQANGVNELGVQVVGPLQIGRLDAVGNAIASDLLPRARMQTAIYAADRHGLWVTYEEPTATTGAKARIRLVHVTEDGHRTVAKGVAPWSIASGDGQTWFLGAVGHTKLRKSGVVDWVLGLVDPRTGKVMRTIRLHLPEAEHPDTGTSKVPAVRILAVMDGAVWLSAGARPVDVAHQELVRVDLGGS